MCTYVGYIQIELYWWINNKLIGIDREWFDLSKCI